MYTHNNGMATERSVQQPAAAAASRRCRSRWPLPVDEMRASWGPLSRRSSILGSFVFDRDRPSAASVHLSVREGGREGMEYEANQL